MRSSCRKITNSLGEFVPLEAETSGKYNGNFLQLMSKILCKFGPISCIFLSKFAIFRRVRPDGNCMYRAMAFGQFQRLLNDPEEAKKFRQKVDEAKEEMVKLGFPVFTMEDFYDNFVETIDKMTCDTDDEDSKAKK